MTDPAAAEAETGAHYELLLRMRDEGGRIISPDNFIVAAERYGITPSIDRWVIENAFRWLVSEADERERLALCSINLSGQSLGDDKFLPFVIDQFQQQRARCQQDLLRDHRDRRGRQLLAGQPLHPGAEGAGLQVRARRLRHRPVLVRLPQALPGRLPQDRRQLRARDPARPASTGRWCARSTRSAHLTGKQTIAEFAENAEIIQMLTSIGVDYAQGYGIAQPRGCSRPPTRAPACAPQGLKRRTLRRMIMIARPARPARYCRCRRGHRWPGCWPAADVLQCDRRDDDARGPRVDRSLDRPSNICRQVGMRRSPHHRQCHGHQPTIFGFIVPPGACCSEPGGRRPPTAAQRCIALGVRASRSLNRKA